ncbi:MAG: hypothetical protein ACJ790_21390 [Myxococcaceae bacterium]
MKIEDYVASGYFVSRWTGTRDCTGVELRRVTLAGDHSQRSFFPDAWALSWCAETRENRIAKAALFGIADHQLDGVMSWADADFGKEFGAWSVFFTLKAAKDAARLVLPNAPDLDVWGVGLHPTLVHSYCEASKPPPSPPGYAPEGASGAHIAACVRSSPLADGGEVLGHEILIDDAGSCFNSPQSRHLDEQAVFRAVGVVPNSYGLIDSFSDALACCRELDAHAGETQHAIRGWMPWLIVRYSG